MNTTNIYQITNNQLNDFINQSDNNKVILFYKDNCQFCKIQIEQLRPFAKKYTNIDYAICNISKAKMFCLDNNIISLPTLFIYKNNVLDTTFNTYIDQQILETKIKELSL